MGNFMSSATTLTTPQEQANSINLKIAEDNGLEILEEPRQLLEVASDEGRELGAQPGGSAVSEVMEDSMNSATTPTTLQEQVDGLILKIEENCMEDLDQRSQLPEVASDVGRELCAQPGGPAVSEVMEDSMSSATTPTTLQEQVDGLILKTEENCMEDLDQLSQLPEVASDVVHELCAQPEGPAVSEDSVTMAQMPNVRKETQTILDLHHGVVESFHHHVKKLDQLTSEIKNSQERTIKPTTPQDPFSIEILQAIGEYGLVLIQEAWMLPDIFCDMGQELYAQPGEPAVSEGTKIFAEVTKILNKEQTYLDLPKISAAMEKFTQRVNKIKKFTSVMEESQRSGITCTVSQVQVDRFILKSALEDCLEDLEELRQLPDVSSDVGRDSFAQPGGPAVSEDLQAML